MFLLGSMSLIFILSSGVAALNNFFPGVSDARVPQGQPTTPGVTGAEGAGRGGWAGFYGEPWPC